MPTTTARLFAVLVLASALGCSKKAPPEPPAAEASTNAPEPINTRATPDLKSDNASVTQTAPPAEPRISYVPVRMVFSGSKDSSKYAKYSSDGKQFLSVGSSGQVTLWETASGRIIQQFKVAEVFKETIPPVSIAASDDLKRVAFGGQDNTAKIWSVETGREEHRTVVHDDFVRTMTFSPDGSILATTTNGPSILATNTDPMIWIWDVATGQLRKKFSRARAFTNQLLFTLDGKEILTGGDAVRRYSLESGLEMGKFTQPIGASDCTISPDGRYVAGGGSDSQRGYTIAVWSLSSGKLLHTLTDQKMSPGQMILGPNGLFAVATSEGFSKQEIHLWDANSGQRLGRIPGHEPIVFSPAGKTLTVPQGGIMGTQHQVIDLTDLLDTKLQAALTPAANQKAFIESAGDTVLINFISSRSDLTTALAALKNCQKPIQLRLSDPTIFTEETARTIAAITSLQSLTIDWDGFQDSYTKYLADLPNLTALDLSHCNKLTPAGIAALAKLHQLESLKLGLVKCDLANLKMLAGLKKLRSINLSLQDIGDDGMAVVASYPSLTELRISSGVTDAGAKHLAGMKKLRRLSFGYCDLSATGFASLQSLTDLEELDLSQSVITDAGLAHAQGLSKLRKLDLSGTKITDAGLAHLAGMTKLTALGLEGADVTGSGLKHLKNAKDLTELNLSGIKLTDDSLVGVKELTQLQSLILPEKITDAGLLHLSGLTNLASINLNSLKNLKGSGLAALKDAKAITELNLTNCAITDTGVAGLKDWKHLENLKLPKTVTDAGLAHLKGHPGLIVIEIDEAKGVTDVGLAYLETLPKLQMISVLGANVSKKKVMELKEKKPGLAIIGNY